MKLRTDSLQTPIGEVQLVALDGKLVLVDFADNSVRIQSILEKRFGTFTLEVSPLPEFRAPLEAYFAGELKVIHTLPVDSGGTPFQREVWNTLLEIPAGTTWSYGQLAAHIGNPTAVRAVGATNGLNPISLVLPCHRVIGSSGALTGYAGGLHRKKWLLEHELKFASSGQTGLFDSSTAVLEERIS
jgi:methylated-DNA-[protein]-cysteine S-methyltransferase